MIQRDTLLNDTSTACQTACGPTTMYKCILMWSKNFKTRWGVAHIHPNPHKRRLNANVKTQRARSIQQDAKHGQIVNPHRHS